SSQLHNPKADKQFQNECKLITRHVDQPDEVYLFVIPLEKKEFGRRMHMAVLACLRLTYQIQQEINRRRLATLVTFESN
ncbi:hypothetical protein BGZ65_012903, partial [Modicella reniformis]